MNRPWRMAALMTGALGCLMWATAAPVAQAAGSTGRTAAAHDTGAARAVGTRALPAAARSLLRHRLPDPELPAWRSPGSAAWRSPARPAAGAGAPATTTGDRKGTVQFATNWSGEVQLGTGLTSVAGNWTVPSLVASTSLQFAATWIGIGGFSGSTLIQTGTVEGTATGEVGYGAWVEILPTPSWTATLITTPGGTPGFLVSPGDAMHAAITEIGTNYWQITIEDVTAGWTYSHAFSYAVDANSAEWITERPTLFTTTQRTTVLATLPNYGSTNFTQLSTSTGGAEVAPSRLTPIRMVDDGNVISAPGPVSSASSTGESFTDSYLTVPSRIYGQTSDATAAAELEHQFTFHAGVCPGSPMSGRAVVLATDKTYPDALASAYLASYLGTGTLLTAPTSLSAATLAAIRDEGITHVYVVGGALAVSTAVATELGATTAYACGGTSPLPLTTKVQVTRVAGETAYDTAFDIATWTGPTPAGVDLAGAYGGVNGKGGDGAYNVTSGTASTSAPTGLLKTAILAVGTGFQDAESASTLAYTDHLPILLTTPSTLSSQALAGVEGLHIQQVLVMGGPFAVSNAVVSALGADGISVLRIAGADGTQTAIELAQCELGSASGHVGLGWGGTGRLTVARGDFYSDGLAGAVVAADGPGSTAPEPLLLTASPTSLGGYLPAFLRTAGTSGAGGTKVRDLTILGGPGAVTQTLANTMEVSLLG